MNRKLLLEAVAWMFGFTKNKASAYVKTCPDEMKSAIIETYLNQMRKAFYND